MTFGYSWFLIVSNLYFVYFNDLAVVPVFSIKLFEVFYFGGYFDDLMTFGYLWFVLVSNLYFVYFLIW